MIYRITVFDILACAEMRLRGHEPSPHYLVDGTYVRAFGKNGPIVTVSEVELKRHDNCEAMLQLIKARCDAAIRGHLNTNKATA